VLQRAAAPASQHDHTGRPNRQGSLGPGRLGGTERGGEVLKGFTEGRIVHYVMPSGEHRPAIIVRAGDSEDGCANLVVFLDGTNDLETGGEPRLTEWQTSVLQAEEALAGTWHWIEPA